MGRFRKRKNRGPRRLRHLLFADRRAQFSAELAAARITARFRFRTFSLSSILPVIPSVPSPPSCGPGVPHALHHLRAARSAAQRANADRRGMEFHGRAAARVTTRLCASPMSGRMDIMDCSASIQTAFRRRFAPIRAGCTAGGTPGDREEHRADRRAVHSRGNTAESLSVARILLVHRGQQQLQRACKST